MIYTNTNIGKQKSRDNPCTGNIYNIWENDRHEHYEKLPTKTSIF